MNGFWLLFRHEVRKKILQRSFLLTTLGIPLLVLLFMGIGIWAVVDPGSSRVVGCVDAAGILDLSAADSGGVKFVAYAEISQAQAALQAGEIRAFYVVPLDFQQSAMLDLYYLKRPPNQSMRAAFDQLLRAGLIKRMQGDVSPRWVEMPKVTVRSMDGSREISEGGYLQLILPFAASFGLVFTVMLSAGSLLQVVAEEKENRTIEILVTTLTPEQLIGGKAAALMAVCLIQTCIWLLTAGVFLLVSRLFFEPLRSVTIPWDLLLLAGLFFLPAYALIAAIMTAIGGACGEMRQSQQIGGLLNILFMLPLFLSTLILQTPDSPLVVFLTLFPTTAFTTVLLRWSLGSVPVWQLLAGWLILTGSSGVTVLLAARIFRLGMLRYGKGLDLRSVTASIKSRV